MFHNLRTKKEAGFLLDFPENVEGNAGQRYGHTAECNNPSAATDGALAQQRVSEQVKTTPTDVSKQQAKVSQD